tara:strand:- start:157 stop:1839 length:1683 start_codon:yes stop_codon:yes gene_type:complete
MKVLLYISFSLWITGSLSQSPYVLLELSNLQPNVGEYITVQVSSNVGSSFELNFPDEFQSGMNVMSGMRQNIVNGSSSTIYYQTLTGFFMESGSFTFGPVKVKSKKKWYKSNKLRVLVNSSNQIQKKQQKNISRRTKRPAIFAETKPSKSKIYRGESIYLQSSIFSKKEFSSIRNYNPYKIEVKYDAFKINASRDLDWIRVAIEGQEYLKLQFEENVIFLNEPGEATIQPFEMVLAGYGSYAVRSEVSSIEVLDLPLERQPINFSGLVGDFQLKVSLSDSNANANDIVSLALEISGLGNLHQMRIPELVLPNSLELYSDPITTDSYRITKSGFKGSIIYTYPIRVLQDGYINISPVELSFFNPKDERYKELQSQNLELNNTGKIIKSTQDRGSLNEEVETESKAVTKNLKPSDKVLWSNAYLISCLSVLLFLLLILFRNKKKWFGPKHRREQGFQTPKLIDVQKAYAVAIKPSDSLESVGLMEQFLFTYCSYVLSQDSIRLSRNEIYVLLSNHIDSEKIEEIRHLFSVLDAYRYSKEIYPLSMKELRDSFKKRVSGFLVN